MASVSIFAAHGLQGWLSNDGPVNLGTNFSVSAANRITAGKYWKGDAANDGLAVTMVLYGATATALATATRTQLASDPIGWVTVPFTTPISVSTGVTYTIAYRSTGATYFVSSSYPLTTYTRAPFVVPANHAVYGYGALAKPTGAGGYSYVVDVVAESADPSTPRSVLALDSDWDGITQAWFNARYAEGVRLFVTSGTPWNVAGTATDNVPRTEARNQFAMATSAGMKIGLYTRDPRHYNTGLDAAGTFINELQFFALDVEPEPGIAVTQEMMDGVAARGVRPIVYAGSGFWDSIQGANSTAFASYPLWDTISDATLNYDIWKNNPDYLAGPPVPYGGWNVPGNYRLGSQQKFDHMLDGILVDLNSFDASFLLDLPNVTVGPAQAVAPWQTVTLSATGSGTWTQVSGTPQALQAVGTTATFVATPSMLDQTLVFGFGGLTTTITVTRALNGIVGTNGSVTPVRFVRK